MEISYQNPIFVSMGINKQLRQPDNWQDFETLCKKLWGEIWDYPEIKKNGRSGQNQSGVDVWGMDSLKRMIGIQCKGKDLYTHKQFCKEEITHEVNKAKLFKPGLSKFYLATTAVKDVGIEEYVRELNQQHLQEGMFEVYLFCWEDIVDLIDENKRTHDWYLNEQKYKNSYKVSFTFDNEKENLTVKPKFKNVTTTFVNKQSRLPETIYRTRGGSLVVSAGLGPYNKETGYNKSFFPVAFRIMNIGINTLRDAKVNISFDGLVQNIIPTNDMGITAILKSHPPDLRIMTREKMVCFTPKHGILVGSEFAISSTFYLKTEALKNKVTVNWELLADGFKQSGELLISVEPQIFNEDRVVSDQTRMGTESVIDDFYEKD